MHTALPLSGPRVRLRHWRDDDLPAFAALNADPQVMAHFPAPLSRSDSDALAARLRAGLAERGWGVWVLARRDDDALLGCVGLNPVAASFPFAPAVEMLWRLARPAWGQGLAHEGAQLALAAARELGMSRVVAFTALGNLRSRALMARLGMLEQSEFDHPALAADSPLRRHVWCEWRM